MISPVVLILRVLGVLGIYPSFLILPGKGCYSELLSKILVCQLLPLSMLSLLLSIKKKLINLITDVMVPKAIVIIANHGPVIPCVNAAERQRNHILLFLNHKKKFFNLNLILKKNSNFASLNNEFCFIGLYFFNY